MAVDINPLVNPYVRKGKVLPPGGQQYLKRRNIRPGMVVPKDICHKAFLQKGWVWGGSWRSVRDYQHFEKKKYKVLSRKSGKRTYNHKSKRENDLVPRQKGSMRQDNRILTKEIGLNHD